MRPSGSANARSTAARTFVRSRRDGHGSLDGASPAGHACDAAIGQRGAHRHGREVHAVVPFRMDDASLVAIERCRTRDVLQADADTPRLTVHVHGDRPRAIGFRHQEVRAVLPGLLHFPARHEHGGAQDLGVAGCAQGGRRLIRDIGVMRARGRNGRLCGLATPESPVVTASSTAASSRVMGKSYYYCLTGRTTSPAFRIAGAASGDARKRIRPLAASGSLAVLVSTAT